MRFSPLAIAALIVAGASASQAQPVLLQIRPRAGDTLSLRLEQRIEMTGGRADCVTAADLQRRSSSRAGTCRDAMRSMTTVTQVFSHAIVNRATSRGAEVTALTDSIRTASFNGSKVPPLKRIVPGESSMRLRVTTDGGAEVLDRGGSAELATAIGPMPATLSGKAVSPGDEWTRELRIPIAGEAGATGLVRATFKLDSLGRNGDIAYISMRGKLSHDHRDGSTSELDGWMTGTMQLDRRLAWITETRATIDVTSMATGRSGGQPMRLRTRVTQVIKAGPAR